ncbi:MAG TPA: SDR family oxidoreductase [Gemmatimonadales bacterium]|nr:SDR family oxidoreductase [Gemmatimonadales bacterium]
MSAEREFLLTGVTGFLGKVVLEELLRRREELGLARVHVLIRPRKQRSAVERFQREVVGSPCFARLEPGWASWVNVVEGALEAPGLSVAPAVQAELCDRVSHILHTAASVSFDLPLAEAARANVATSLNLLELSRHCTRLERLVYVSTAYVTPHPGEGVPIKEVLAPLPAPAAELYQAILDRSVNETELLRRSGHPNTYTLTKSLAEHLLLARRGRVPLAIIRPSIISASWRYPFPGWLDSLSGFASFVVLIGSGHLRAVAGLPGTRLDLIPVDEVADRMLEECRPDGGTSSEPVIRHVVAGLDKTVRLAEVGDRILEFFSVHRVDRRPVVKYLGARGFRFQVAETLYHRLPIAVARLRPHSSRKATGQLKSRLAYLNRIFPYFTCSRFAFETSRPLDAAFEAGPYVTTVCRGAYRHMLHRDESQWTMAGRKHPGQGGDFRWALTQPEGNLWIRFSAWLVTKVLRRAIDRVTVDIPSFEAARRAAPEGSPLVLVPNHRSYLDFVLCSYLCFARPDLGIRIPHIAATIEFGRIPILGRILTALHAFYLRRGTGREDPELTRRVHELIAHGKTLEFFIEGQRSRSREFLPPKRGLLRCLQATGRNCTLLPVAFSYDRIPEERAFAHELAGQPKPRMRLTALLGWAIQVWRGKIELGRVHLACGEPVSLGRECDVQSVSQELIRRLAAATVSTTYHLQAWLTRCPVDGLDPGWLRSAIEARGGRVLESPLRPAPDLDPLIAASLRHQFAHHFQTDGSGDPRLLLLHQKLFPAEREVSQTAEPVG